MSRASERDEDRLQLRWCGDCEARTLFEVPPCQDGHGEECLDLACVDCGAALVVGVLLVAGEPARGSHAA